MIGIVVVSHSRALAEAAVGLAGEMVDSESGPRMAVAAGLDATTFGTDATAVSAAIEEVDSDDGVLVLLDLGSAVLSAEMALEFLDPGVAGRVRLSSAPLVEGLVAAVVLAATGADLDSVAEEAGNGLLAKQSHLGVPETGATEPAAPRDNEVDAQPDAEAEVTVTNAHGLHARPAAKVVSLLRGFDATTMLTNLDSGRGPVNVASLSAVATLDARRGHRLRVTASGPQAADAVHAFEELADRAFDDQSVPSPASAGKRPSPSSGSGLDLAMGPALVLRAAVDVSAYEPGEVPVETARSEEAVTAVRRQLHDLERRTTEESGPEEGAIFDAHLALLDDPEVTESIAADLASGASAVEAWRRRLDTVAEGFEALPDAYQRERAADVRSVQTSVLRQLTGLEPADLVTSGEPVVLVVDELDAATSASIDVEKVAGVAVIARGDTGHGVIIAASRGIPLITGVGGEGDRVGNGQIVAFDARLQFWAEPSDETLAGWSDHVEQRRAERATAVVAARQPASTTDGTSVPVLANIASVADAESALSNGADGSGLVRTEVLFGERDAAPSVEEQTETFLGLAAALDGRPLTIRTWDIGGDKPLPFLRMQPEANPFLGVRGIRAFALDPSGEGTAAAMFRDQLTAVVRTARETPIRVMFPMVTNAGEVRRAIDILERVADDDGGRPEVLEVGIMVEVPAAAITVDLLAAGLDFVSIGTNDLTQYATAADRGNDAVADLADPLNPGVLRLIDHVCRNRPQGVEVAVCGDLASRPNATALLLGLGVDELSCTPPKVPEVKAAVRRTDLDSARSMAARVLQTDDRGEIHELMSMSGTPF